VRLRASGLHEEMTLKLLWGANGVPRKRFSGLIYDVYPRRSLTRFA
jgi:hypothetical protein